MIQTWGVKYGLLKIAVVDLKSPDKTDYEIGLFKNAMQSILGRNLEAITIEVLAEIEEKLYNNLPKKYELIPSITYSKKLNSFGMFPGS